MYLDNLNLIVQKNGDGGDTLQRTGFYFLPGIIKNNLNDKLLYLESLEKMWPDKTLPPLRHPIQYPDPKDVSRDQLTPNIVTLGFLKMDKYICFIFIIIIKNLFRYPNNDLMSPENLGQFIRGMLNAKNFKWFLFYPLIWLGDLFMLLGVIIRCFQAKKPDNVGDDLNTLVSVVQAQYLFPTPISFIARKIYKWCRPKPCIEIKKINEDLNMPNCFLALKWYFREESGGNPEIAEAWRGVCEKL